MTSVRNLAVSLLMVAAASSLHAGVLPLNEGFDDITTLSASGWAVINNSSPTGLTTWFQGNEGVFSSQSGSSTSYIGANFNNAGEGGAISNWLLTPVIALDSPLQFTFYTRTVADSAWPDALEIRVSANGSSTDVGSTTSSLGDFATLLLQINPDVVVGGYPTEWTQYTINFSGGAADTTGRFAFRYVASDNVSYSNYIGIDTVSISQTGAPSETPEPATFGLMALGLGGALLRRRLCGSN
jgi:hypothetical protein